jgi:hypothetical protein
MDFETIKRAIDSLEGYQGQIVITGGEPTLHPNFADICAYLKKKVPPDQRYLQTTGYKWDQYKGVIKKTFRGRVQYNEHKDPNEKHHPILVAIKDIVTDDLLRNELIDRCWVKERWAAAINPKGCYYCEIAGAFDVLYNGPGGLPIENGWWTKSHEHFIEQLERYCSLCGAALPQEPVQLRNQKDHVSISNFIKLERLETPKFQKNHIFLVNSVLSAKEISEIAKTWEPWVHNGDEPFRKTTSQYYLSVVRLFLKNHKFIWLGYKKIKMGFNLAWRFFWNINRRIN